MKAPEMNRRTILLTLMAAMLTCAVAFVCAFAVRSLEIRREAAVTAGLAVLGIRMTEIPGGTFVMGTTDVEPQLREHYRPHRVTVSPFSMSVCEITAQQFFEITGIRHGYFNREEEYPVISVQWREAVEFCNALSERYKLDKCYNEYFWVCDRRKNGFRLPTEAEWEYACRAGTSTHFYNGNSEADLARAGWYRGNSQEQLHPGGLKEKNAWGLADMTGNVIEWCDDYYGIYPSEPQIDPTGAKYGSNRVLRGGSWFHSTYACRSTFRLFGNPENIRAYVGFRIVRSRREPSGWNNEGRTLRSALSLRRVDR